MTERADTPSLLQPGSAALSSQSPSGSPRAPTISANRCSPITETDSERLPRPVAALISEGGPALCLVHGSVFVIRLRKSVLPIRQTSSCARPTLTKIEFSACRKSPSTEKVNPRYLKSNTFVNSVSSRKTCLAVTWMSACLHRATAAVWVRLPCRVPGLLLHPPRASRLRVRWLFKSCGLLYGLLHHGHRFSAIASGEP